VTDRKPHTGRKANEPRGQPIMLLGTAGPSTNILHNALCKAFPNVQLVLEAPVPKMQLLRRRAYARGWRLSLGQAAFAAVIVPLLRSVGRRRIDEIVAQSGLDLAPPAHALNVSSVNSDEARAVLSHEQPSVVVVNCRRIISAETLDCVPSPFINIHAGVTPRFRGVHGGYWALVEGCPELAGTTIHLVDQGIDTGPILAQRTFTIGHGDSFATYPYLHLAVGLPVLVETIEAILRSDQLVPRPPIEGAESSRLWQHPTAWGYLSARVRKRVK
jgi:phosphoribosylglycinamide formyltransferase-1